MSHAGSSAEESRLSESLPVFAALADETRLRLVSRLCAEGPSSISQLTNGSAVTRQAISKHLRMMEEAGLLRATRQGRERIWQLEPRGLENARRCLDAISAEWDGALGRLKAFVER
jgi:DNA-binding transcriptional ArsR family regulator